MTPTNTPALTDQMQLVWVQNLIGMIEGTFHPTDRWNAIFIEQLSKLPAPPRVDPAPASEAADVAEIPQEILDEADEICSQIAEFGKPAQETIARALMARDQRAAEIARHLNGWGSNPAPELAEHIATAILTYGAKP